MSDTSKRIPFFAALLLLAVHGCACDLALATGYELVRQSRITLSCSPVAICLSSASQATAVTDCSVLRLPSAFPSATFQARADLSVPPLRSREPSAEN